MGRIRRAALCALTVLALTMAALTGVLAVPPRAAADDPTVSYDSLRTGLDPNEPGLSPATVASSGFGSLFTATLPKPSGATANQVYAQPIVAGGTLVVATEENQLHGLDPATGAVRWTTSLGPSWPASTSGCGDLTPDIGITSTPVYDASTNTVYAVGKVNDGPDVHHPRFLMAAVDATTGAMRAGWPTSIAGAPTNDPFRPMDPAQAGQRPGLLLLDGRVYAGFASHCSYLPYVGYVAGVDTSTRAVKLWTTEAGGSSAGGGVWQSGGGLMSDGPGRVLFATGNGFASASPAVGPGSAPPAGLAESAVRLGVGADGTLSAQDFFSPVNNPTLDRNDTDLGSGGLVGLPDSFGTASHPHLAVVAGKDGRIFLLDRDSLGGTGQGPGGTDAVLSQAQIKGVWGHAAVWPGDGGYLYLVENGGNVRAIRVSADAGGVPQLSLAGASAETFGYTSGSPVVTASGTSSGSALVWVVQSSGPTGAGGRLLAYDAAPVGGALRLRFSAALGNVAKFVVPATDAGRVYVGTRDGTVVAFGRPSAPVFSAAAVDVGSVAVGSTGTATATLTAQKSVVVTGLAADAPFAVGSGAPSVPRSVSAGQSISVPVTFTPSSPDARVGVLRVSTANDGVFAVDLRGLGTAPGLAATPSSVGFGSVAVGAAKRIAVSVRNTGTDAVTLASVSGPAAPFAASGLPAVGDVVPAGGVVTFTVTAAPTAGGDATGAVRLGYDGGAVTVPLSVTGVNGSAHLTLAPASLDFGRIEPGAPTTLSFDITNTGTAPLTLTKAAPPSAPFRVDNPVPEGTVLAPGQVIHQAVSFVPTSGVAATGAYGITGDDGQGSQAVTVSGNSTPPVGAITLGVRCLSTAASGLAGCSTGDAQRFRLPGDSTVRSVGSSCLNASGTAAGSKVSFAACANVGGQKWNWQADQTLANRKSGLCLASSSGSTLTLATCAAVAAQQFDLSALVATRGPATVLGSLCLDVARGATADGTAVQDYSCNATAAQRVTVTAGTLQVLGSCVRAGGRGAGSAVVLGRCSGGSDQQWLGQPDGRVINPVSGRCLDVPGGKPTPGVRLQLWTCNGTSAQRWTLPV